MIAIELFLMPRINSTFTHAARNELLFRFSTGRKCGSVTEWRLYKDVRLNIFKSWTILNEIIFNIEVLLGIFYSSHPYKSPLRSPTENVRRTIFYRFYSQFPTTLSPRGREKHPLGIIAGFEPGPQGGIASALLMTSKAKFRVNFIT